MSTKFRSRFSHACYALAGWRLGPHRFAAACSAISARRSGDNFSRRAASPPRPSDWAAASLPNSPKSSSASPVKILATRIALATVPTGHFWPCDPFGTASPLSKLNAKRVYIRSYRFSSRMRCAHDPEGTHYPISPLFRPWWHKARRLNRVGATSITGQSTFPSRDGICRRT